VAEQTAGIVLARADAKLRLASAPHRQRIVAVVYREAWSRRAGPTGALAQHAQTEGMKRRQQETTGLLSQQLHDPLPHFGCRFVGEREATDGFRGDGERIDQIGDPVGQDARFARASSSQNQAMAALVSHSLPLLGVERSE
jgi:hypothetical protein